MKRLRLTLDKDMEACITFLKAVTNFKDMKDGAILRACLMQAALNASAELEKLKAKAKEEAK